MQASFDPVCVLDPFAGAGTVLLEAISANRVAIGADSNAMARLISQVKTHPLPSVSPLCQ